LAEQFCGVDASSAAIRSTIEPGYTDPVFDDQIWAIETFGNSVFVGGEFTAVNGVTRKRLVKLDAETGAVDTAFNARFRSGIVWDLQMWTGPDGASMLIVGGSIGKRLMALDPDTGADTGYFDLGIDEPIPNAWGGLAVYKFAVDPAGTRLVATGNFRTVAGQPRTRLFVADLDGPTATLAA
jgi:hypothetical protein